MNRRLLDTNFIIRHLLQDNAAHAETTQRFFQATDSGVLIGIILQPVLAECVYVLESYYKLSRAMIAARLTTLLTAPNLRVDAQSVCLNALKRYTDTKFHFIDCLLAATAVAEDCPVATFDTDFRRFKDVQVKVD